MVISGKHQLKERDSFCKTNNQYDSKKVEIKQQKNCLNQKRKNIIAPIALTNYKNNDKNSSISTSSNSSISISSNSSSNYSKEYNLKTKSRGIMGSFFR